MLEGRHVVLRARQPADVPVLHEELYDDVPTRARADTRAWVPLGPDCSPYAVHEPAPDAAEFSVVEKASGQLAGEAVLWQIDPHNRSAHAGLALRPSLRGKGLGVDALRVLTTYALVTRGLHRVQLEVVADNQAMLAAAARAGYQSEGVQRLAVWVQGRFVDQVIMSALAPLDDPVPPADRA